MILKSFAVPRECPLRDATRRVSACKVYMRSSSRIAHSRRDFQPYTLGICVPVTQDMHVLRYVGLVGCSNRECSRTRTLRTAIARGVSKTRVQKYGPHSDAPRPVSSSCSVRATWVSAWGSVMCE